MVLAYSIAMRGDYDTGSRGWSDVSAIAISQSGWQGEFIFCYGELGETRFRWGAEVGSGDRTEGVLENEDF